jgi:hypothetical protein
VSFSNCVASSSHVSLRSRILPLILARSAVEGFVRRSRGNSRTKVGNQSISKVIQVSEDATIPSTSSQSLSTKSKETSPETQTHASTNTSVPSSAQGGSPSRVPSAADPQLSIQSGPNKASNGPLGNAGNIPSVAVASAPPVPPPAKPHVPYEVIIGKSPELGVSCYVEVKIRDGITEKITVPTSVALEAACKARRASGTRKRAKKLLLNGKSISVIGLGVWTKTEPHVKVRSKYCGGGICAGGN